MLTLGDLAFYLKVPCVGDSDLSLSGIASLTRAHSRQVSFLAHARYKRELSTTRAGAVILREEDAHGYSGGILISENPYADYARVTRLFDNRPKASRSIHESADVAEDVSIGENVTIDSGAVIESGVRLDDGVWVGASCWVGHGAEIGADTELRAGVRIYHAVRLGARCLIHANTVIGSDGFGFAPTDERWEKILQLASVLVGDDVEIGANCSVDRGALEDTVIEDGVIIDNLVHVAHGVQIGQHSAVAGQAGFAGGVKLGAHCTVGGQAGFAGNLVIANGVHIGGQGRVTRSVAIPGQYASGTNLQPMRDWAKNAIRFEQLQQMTKRLDRIEAALGKKSGDVEGDPSK